MATNNRDVREIMAARKTRRAIPQVDPAEVVEGPPEPEILPPDPEIPASTTPQSEQPEETTSIPASASDASVGDPRTQPVPADDPYTPTTLRVRNHHRRQLKAEAYYKGLLMQDILETALDEYFKKRYGRRR
jgi:hypothetical protein